MLMKINGLIIHKLLMQMPNMIYYERYLIDLCNKFISNCYIIKYIIILCKLFFAIEIFVNLFKYFNFW